MPTPRKFHIQASQYQEALNKNRAIQIGKVVCFLRQNPLSTSDEVFKATGCGVSIAYKYVRQTKYNGQTCWRLNHKKLP